jgi:hypothetical protein
MSMIGTATTAGIPCARRLAPRIPVKAMTEPTDRSIPPVRITNVRPTARTTRYALSSSSAERLPGLRNFGNRACALMRSTIRIATAANVGMSDARLLMKVAYRDRVSVRRGASSRLFVMTPPPLDCRHRICFGSARS